MAEKTHIFPEELVDLAGGHVGVQGEVLLSVRLWDASGLTIPHEVRGGHVAVNGPDLEAAVFGKPQEAPQEAPEEPKPKAKGPGPKNT